VKDDDDMNEYTVKKLLVLLSLGREKNRKATGAGSSDRWFWIAYYAMHLNYLLSRYTLRARSRR
jgi:hypothetical protein